MSPLPLLLCVLIACTKADSYFYPKSVLYDPYPGLPPLPFPALHYLCVGREGTLLFLPWDCTGYVSCHHDKAYWTRCPFDERSVGILKEPICVYERATCRSKEKARWREFCLKTNRDRHPSSTNCAAYHDCRVGNEGVERQCTYPDLFNPTTKLCEDYRTAQALCGSRNLPEKYFTYIMFLRI